MKVPKKMKRKKRQASRINPMNGFTAGVISPVSKVRGEERNTDTVKGNV